MDSQVKVRRQIKSHWFVAEIDTGLPLTSHKRRNLNLNPVPTQHQGFIIPLVFDRVTRPLSKLFSAAIATTLRQKSKVDKYFSEGFQFDTNVH